MPAPHHSFFTGWMPFLLPNQQHQSIEGRSTANFQLLPENQQNKYKHCKLMTGLID